MKYLNRFCRRSCRVLGTVAALVLTAAWSPAPAAAAAAADGAGAWDAYRMVQYLSVGKRSPEGIAALDSNGEILLACRDGCSLEELRTSGLSVLDSQVELLRTLGMLQDDSSGRLVTGFPVLDAETTLELRRRIEELAGRTLLEVGDESRAFLEAVRAAGHRGWAYSLVFSYVLDGMVWEFLDEYRMVPDRRRRSTRSPHWTGVYWVHRPPRPEAPRTLVLSGSPATLKMTVPGGAASPDLGPWRAAATELSQALGAGTAGDADEAGAGAEDRPQGNLNSLGLMDPDGRWLVPVVDEAGGGPVFRAAENLTEGLLEELQNLDVESWSEGFGLGDAGQTLVIVYHELMWELIDRLVTRESLTRPEAAGAGTAFLVRRAVTRELATVDGRDPRKDSENVDD